jgi:hypothetical protein
VFGRRLRRSAAGPPLAVRVTDDGAALHRPSRPDARASLRRIVSEVVILQDQAEAMLDALRDERDLGDIAPICGQMIGRFVVLGEALKGCTDPAVASQVALVRAILDHHVLLMNSALMFLASEWRSERLAHQLDALDGLGAPARRLELVWAELCAGAAGPR